MIDRIFTESIFQRKNVMAIQMIGIDHSVAAIDIRTIFSFTQKKTVEALEIIKQEKGICGCVLLSTCNRMELWVSTEEGCVIALYELLCKIRAIHNDEYQKYFTERKEEDAVQHLFRLACGLESRILGEDQILTQVKGALVTAREHYAADNVLEVLFRMAVTAGKKVRTNVTFSTGNHSVIHRALQTLRQEGLEVKGKKCMVIGNGEMGKLAATVLQQEGTDVTVTVRQYRSGVVQIPQGCRRIDYGKRMGLISSCDFVVSATASPNYTLTKEGLQAVDLDHELILVDLAVPRDIDPEVQKLMYIRFYDIDYFKVDVLSKKVLFSSFLILVSNNPEIDSHSSIVFCIFFCSFEEALFKSTSLKFTLSIPHNVAKSIHFCSQYFFIFPKTLLFRSFTTLSNNTS